MLISALNSYYDILSRKGVVCPEGMSRQGITHKILLSPDGKITGIADIRTEKKETTKSGKEKVKKLPVSMLMPLRTQKPGIDSNIIEHRPLYIFGLNYDKKSGELSPEDSTEKARKSHKSFVKANLAFTEGMKTEIVLAYRNFIERWIPENETENEYLKALGADLGSGYFCFALDGRPSELLHDSDGEIVRKIKNGLSDTEDKEADGICAVTGEKAVIARLHDKIKGIAGGQSSGGLLVCVNNAAEASYGKVQSFNSSISEKVMKHYTEALNVLTADESHRIYLEGLTIVFWAMKEDDGAEVNLVMNMLNRRKNINDEKIDSILDKAFKYIKEGMMPDLDNLNIDEDVIFYIAGLAPNSSRIAQKFVYKNKFGSIFKNAAMHQYDLRVDGSNEQIPLWRILSEMKSPKTGGKKNDKKDSNNVPPPLFAAIIKAILDDTAYPDSLLETIVRRVKTDSDTKVNYVRAGIIKACINRRQRTSGKKEEITVALDNDNTNSAYLCGRLFAVLERIQEKAAGTDLNRTIKDSHFASACARPAVVYPGLMKLAQYHLRKFDSRYENILLGKIMAGLSTQYPKMLSITEQGKFILGYYHQREEFYKKKEDKTDSDNNENGGN